MNVRFVRRPCLGLAAMLLLAFVSLANAESGVPAHDWTYAAGTSIGDAYERGDEVNAVVVDRNGIILFAGGFGHECEGQPSPMDFDPGIAVDLRTAQGYHDVFVATLSPTGEYLNTITFGGPGDDTAFELLPLAQETGNVAVEVRYRDKPSGVMATTADRYVLVAGKMAYMVRTAQLRSLVKSGNFTEVAAGDHKLSRVVLLPLETLRSLDFVQKLNLPEVGG